MIVPADFTFYAQKVATAAYAAASIAGLAPQHRRVVQAGGCIGLWPLALAGAFASVVTFEPAPTNFEALEQNIAAQPTIDAYPYALGSSAGAVGLMRPRPHAGLWRVEGDGTVPRVALDDVLMEPVDALVLDVEGAEIDVWDGAEDLIARHRPLLWFEYLEHQPAMDAWLAAHGYCAPRRGCGGDWYSTPKES